MIMTVLYLLYTVEPEILVLKLIFLFLLMLLEDLEFDKDFWS